MPCLATRVVQGEFFRLEGTPMVASLNRPGGNLTGVSFMALELAAKRIGLLHELAPAGARLAMLASGSINPDTEAEIRETRSAAATFRRQIDILTAATSQDIDAAFETLADRRTGALVVNAGVLFSNRRVQIVTLATHGRIPVIYFDRMFVEVGGLMSYGSNILDQFRQAGIYVGRILKGDKPADLPVMRPTKFEFIINLQTAKTLGIAIPPTLLALADEVIE
jgi:putative ABC transport system substrate-binding protein